MCQASGRVCSWGKLYMCTCHISGMVLLGWLIPGADPGFGNEGGGGKISSEASYIYERREY